VERSEWTEEEDGLGKTTEADDAATAPWYAGNATSVKENA